MYTVLKLLDLLNEYLLLLLYSHIYPFLVWFEVSKTQNSYLSYLALAVDWTA